ncbi:uncharacterized protein LOC127848574 isoform X2 [Dreissena polymorpha]|uniref:uncharacterized protein LOC127848574 isoform X2 n=1 Tax=Dreissena polymorpha TaxID=45954 RepID=UPI00226401FD|nr:uncharacterized protein LOC127848574 isoform X2 [Dreissena polymorpha]
MIMLIEIAFGHRYTSTNRGSLSLPSKSNELPEQFFNTTTTDLGNEKQIKVISPDGALLATITIFEIEGYEVDKPTDRNKCLLSKVSENVTCYDEVPVADIDAIPDNIAAFCKGREVLNLVPTDCNKQADVPSDSTNPGVVKRSVYSTCGRWIINYHTYCWDYCCSQLWTGQCFRYCTICTTTTIWTYHTLSGYEYPF